MDIRRYKIGEEEKIWTVFYRSTREIVSHDYTREQIERWAPKNRVPAEWAKRIFLKKPFVAVEGDEVVGFAELEEDGHIDLFYCLPEWVGKGVGTSLLEALEAEAMKLNLSKIYAESSTTAIQFFVAKGFRILEIRINTVCGEAAKQYLIEKRIASN